MAVDEFMFQSLGEKAETFLRFYRWMKPTVSIGRSQKVEKIVDMDFCHRNGIDIVRRITGGKLVLHHKEVTYAVCSSDSDIFSKELRDSYRLISQALNLGLQRMGIDSCLAKDTPFGYARGVHTCFSIPARDEIQVGGKKIIGSAQKRTGKKFIQHGSIPLEKDTDLLLSTSQSDQNESIVKMTSLSEALGKKVDFDFAVKHFISGMSDYFGVNLVSKTWTKTDKDAIQKILAERYENPDWTYAY